ncbi:hypothetical protein H9633_12145 [Microbacterium sp. Re1]|uniref:Uncharacterized protein n=1 Tax=Microbacterium commune TaxID=2762219 RepID=A0ABR8W7Q9_9MICO|nr:hypothetical protein [Microbacterium commune]MBD8013043.1 hypothetical protein [Microbacterium commune]
MATTSIDPFARQRELLDEWLDVRAEINRLQARAATLLAQRVEVMDADVATAPMHREAIRRSMVAEYSAAGRMAKGAVEQAFSDARALRDVREILRAAGPLIQARSGGTATEGAVRGGSTGVRRDRSPGPNSGSRAAARRGARAADSGRAAPRGDRSAGGERAGARR